MKRLLASLTAPLLAVSLLAGCSDAEEPSAGDNPSTETSPSAPEDDPSAAEDGADDAAGDAAGAGTEYCKLLSTDFATLFANIKGPDDVAEAIGIIKQIGSAAPAEVEGEWGRMQGALGQVESALTKAAQLQKKAAAGDVTSEQLQKQTAKLSKDMQTLNTPANAKAGDTVAKHATDYCGLTLG